MKKYVVTGGGGFIGSALVRGLLGRSDGTVEVIDNFSTGRRENLAEIASSIKLHLSDICDFEAIAPVIAGAEAVKNALHPAAPRRRKLVNRTSVAVGSPSGGSAVDVS